MSNRTTETNYFFKIMSLLADAKAANNLEGIAECIDDLEAMAMHFDTAMLANRSAAEAERASALLADLQSQRFGYAGPLVVLTNAAHPANLN